MYLERPRRKTLSRLAARLILTIAAAPGALRAQEDSATTRVAPSLKFGIGVGDRPRVVGLRLNYRDDHLKSVYGANVTIWEPRRDTVGGYVYGVALGLPVAVGARVRGVAVAGLGVEVTGDLTGVAIAPLLYGDRAVRGIALGGVMLGSNGRATGIAAAPILVPMSGMTGGSVSIVAAGEGPIKGITLTGLLVADDVGWVQLSGLGVVANHNVSGVSITAGAVHGGDVVQGINIGGLSVAGHAGIRGLAAGGAIVYGPVVKGAAVSSLIVAPASIDGVAVAAGGLGTEALRGIGVAGLLAFVPKATGVVASSMAEVDDMTGVVVAPLLFGSASRLRGLSISGWNALSTQRGIAIGLLNQATRLHGAQIGLWNVAANNPHPFRRLPLINLHFGGD
jgi:hypothetical protein